MSKKLFTEKEIKQLQKNPYVKNVTKKGVTYTDEMRKFFIIKKSEHIPTTMIFELAGFDTCVLGRERVNSASNRWMRNYKNGGELGLKDRRKTASGRPLQRTLSAEEKIARLEAKMKLLEAEKLIFKKVETIGKRGVKLAKAEIYELINTIISEYQLKRMTTYLCQVAAVSTSGYYRYFSDAAFDARKIRKQQDTAKASIIRKAMKRCGYEKGSRQIKMFLDRSEKYEVMSLKTIQRIMKKFNITCSYRQKSKQKAIMKATQEHHTAPNVLHRQFKTGIARKVLLTDISYLPYYGGKTAYLSAVIDAETTELLGHVVSPSLKIEFVLKTIEQVFGKREFELAEGALINSDQGCHYTSPQFKKLVESKGLIQSMSRRGNCWDNAPIESFFGHLKDNIDLEDCRTFKEVKQEVDSYIRYYNNFRYKWNLKKMTPVEYRNHLLAQ